MIFCFYERILNVIGVFKGFGVVWEIIFWKKVEMLVEDVLLV